MNINSLELKEYKNYKILCSVLEDKVKTGKSKQLQQEDWKRYFKWDKKGHKFIITEIYDKPKEKIDGRINNGLNPNSYGNNIIDIPNFKVDRKDWNSIGVYTIILDNNIYIGSTIAGFRDRFRRHNSRNGTLHLIQQIC